MGGDRTTNPGTTTLGTTTLGTTTPGGDSNPYLRVVVLRGNCPTNRGNCPQGNCPTGVMVLGGSCPGGNCPRGSCPMGVIVLRGSRPEVVVPRVVVLGVVVLEPVWAHIGGKWVLFGAWREGNGVPLYGCVLRGFVSRVLLEGLHPYDSLEMESHELLEDSGLKSLTCGCHAFRAFTTPLWVYLHCCWHVPQWVDC